jgi:hypothetical protein
LTWRRRIPAGLIDLPANAYGALCWPDVSEPGDGIRTHMASLNVGGVIVDLAGMPHAGDADMLTEVPTF